MTDTAKLREALAKLNSFVDLFIDDETRIFNAAREYLALLESSDVILIRRDAEGNWPADENDPGLDAALAQFIHIGWANDARSFDGIEETDRLRRLSRMSDFQQAVSIVHAYLDALSDSLKGDG